MSDLPVPVAVEDFDLVILGSGEAGKYLAWTFGKAGRKVAVVERKYLGGACPNIACLPSKNVIHSAKVASYFARAAEFGIRTNGYEVDMSVVRDRKRTMVEGLMEVHRKNYAASGAEIVWGSGVFVAPRTLKVTLNDGGGERLLRGENVVINTGTRAALPDIPGLAEAQPLTHVEALELDEVPRHMILLGGGYIGLEFAQAMRRLGSEVTILERGQRLLTREDEDVSAAVEEILKQEGIRIIHGAAVEQIEALSGDSVFVTLKGSAAPLEGSHLLAAAGRTPNTGGIGLEAMGIRTDGRGYIEVNERLQTTAEGVWAAGDCAGSPHFTHISYDDFRVIRDNLQGLDRTTTGRQVPHCLFIDPELAQIGLTEQEAKAAGIPYRLVKVPMAAVLRTRTLSETHGFMKALLATDSDLILGLTILGTGAGEMMAPVQIAMLGGLPYTLLRDAVLTHPTLAEGIMVLFSHVPARD